MNDNHLSLRATIIGKEATRYTPAGIPVTQLTLQHEGEQLEAGAPRAVAFELTAQALGTASAKAQAAKLGQVVQVQGFMASTRKGARTLILHITEIALENTERI